jgi:hypothetical protein
VVRRGQAKLFAEFTRADATTAQRFGAGGSRMSTTDRHSIEGVASLVAGKRAFNIRAASLSFALLFPSLLTSRLT